MYTKRHIFNSFLLLFLLLIRVNIFSQTAEGKEKGVNQWSTFTEENRTPCQILEAAWDTLNITPLPADTGSFLYIPLCLGDSVHFILYGIYPQNGQYYTQHDTLNIYTWDFGDGTQLTTQTPQAWHRYDSARGYEMNVYMTDTNDCISRPLIARILVTQNPVSAVNPIPQICVGDTTAIQPSSFVNFVPYSYSQISSQKFDSTMFIPDGPNCNPAHPCYNTDVIFTSFLPNQIITSASDILSVCVFMEHSYVGDLNFVIRCPNGQTDTLKKYIHWGGADMGIPGTPDSGCDPRNNPQGTPWNYCWSEIYPNIGTINANAGQARLDSTDRTNQLKYYLPDNDFSHLIGCPLNGIWSIEICDYWAVDNGYIFEWTLNLSPNLLPQAWGYVANIDSTWIDGPFIISHSNGGAIIAPQDSGTYNYTVYFRDEFGCTWDTTVSLNVLPLPVVDLGPDQSVCQGTSVVLSAPPGNASYLWNTGQTTSTITVTQAGTYTVTVTAFNSCQNADSIQIIVHPLPVPKLIHHR